jgi:ATP-dependent Clp protease ATP-binding subunit ClpA
MLVQLASQGSSGARDLDRVFQQHVDTPLSRVLIEGGGVIARTYSVDYDEHSKSVVILRND